MAQITFKEGKRLISKWSKGTFPTVSESIKYHFARHGTEVSAENIWQYLRKANNFAENLRGARKGGIEKGFTRYMKTVIILSRMPKGKFYRLEQKDERF